MTVPAEPGEEKNISVSYEFTSKTKDAQLPAEVLALLPKDTNSYAKGEAVKAIQPEKTTVKVTNGTWKFEGYDADEKEAVTGLSSPEAGVSPKTGQRTRTKIQRIQVIRIRRNREQTIRETETRTKVRPKMEPPETTPL